MYRLRLRDKLSNQELAHYYSKPHRHSQWPDHIQRVLRTIEAGLRLTATGWIGSVADLSCGDGTVAKALAASVYSDPILGDFAPGYEFTGPMEQTILQIPTTDLFVCCETLEHLDDPEYVLSEIGHKAEWLLLSTPNCDYADDNPEHLWAWDKDAIWIMLQDTRWMPVAYEESYTGRGYRYQIWTARLIG